MHRHNDRPVAHSFTLRLVYKRVPKSLPLENMQPYAASMPPLTQPQLQELWVAFPSGKRVTFCFMWHSEAFLWHWEEASALPQPGAASGRQGEDLNRLSRVWELTFFILNPVCTSFICQQIVCTDKTNKHKKSYFKTDKNDKFYPQNTNGYIYF